jgi:hypothetical protein
MVSRKKAPADMRTVDLFTGKTKLEEVEDMLAEEAANDAPKERLAGNERFEQEETAIRWLGLDAFDTAGDDCRVALGKSGAVLMLIDSAPDGNVRAMREFKLSTKQWKKLCSLTKESGPQGTIPRGPTRGDDATAVEEVSNIHNE